MKLIIDVPEYVYESIREYYEKNDTVESTYGYIYHGTPIPDNATVCDIEQIRAEIEQLHYHPKLDFIKNDDVVEKALKIIDKHR